MKDIMEPNGHLQTTKGQSDLKSLHTFKEVIQWCVNGAVKQRASNWGPGNSQKTSVKKEVKTKEIFKKYSILLLKIWNLQ